MKKLLFASLLTVAVAFAQATGGSPGKASETTKATKTKTKTKAHRGKKADKSKKGSGGTTTPAPK